MLDEKRFIWMIILYNCLYRKESGVLSDFEKVLGYEYQNKSVRDFLKYLIEEKALEFKDFRLVKNNSFETYVINKKRIFEIIKENEIFFKNIMKMINDKYIVVGDWT